MKTKLLVLFSFLAMQLSSAKSVACTVPILPNVTPLTYCDPNNDGFGVFDLTEVTPIILAAQSGAASNYQISYHETFSMAATGSNSITGPYNNITPWSQQIYYRIIEIASGDAAVGSFQLVVNPLPVAGSVPSISVCDTDANPQNGITPVDLTQQVVVILAMQPLAASNYSVAFYTNQASAFAGAAPIFPTTTYVGSNGETIWYRVENNSTHCYNVGSFQLVVNATLPLTVPTPLMVCDSDAQPNNQHTYFDLTIKNNEITQGLAGYTVTYFPSLSNAQTGINAISNPAGYINVIPAIQTLGVKVTSPSGCSSITTLDIRVLPIPTPNTNPMPLAPQCDVNYSGDMMEYFDLTYNASYIVNGDPNLVLHYYNTMSDAISSINEILNPTAALVGSNVWIRVENNRIDFMGNHCYVLVEQPLTVNPLPTIVQPLSPYRVCDDNNDGLAIFDLTSPSLTSMILGPTQQALGYFVVSYYASPANAASGVAPLPSTYLNVTPYSQNIYIRVLNNFTGCVSETGILTLAVEQPASASGPQSYATCDDNGNPYDGSVMLNLTQYESAILNGQNPAVFLLSYYTSLANAQMGTNALTQVQAYQTAPYTDTIWVRVENSSNSITPHCYALTTINISVTPYPNPIISTANGFNTVYVDAFSHSVVQPLLLDSGVTGNYSYQWYENGGLIVGATNSTYLVDTPTPNNESRTYSVRVQSNNTLGCYNISSIYLVLQSNEVPPPSGIISQSLPAGSTLADIVVSGSNIQWYAIANGKNSVSTFSTPLPLNTVLVDGTTYYASQIIGGIESIQRLPITVHLTLGVEIPEIASLRYAPNPVKNNLTLQSAVIVKSVSVYTMLGQKVFEQNYNDMDLAIDLSRLTTGNYILKAKSETGEKTIRIIKE